MQLRLLAISLVVAVALALLFVKAVLWLGLSEQLNFIIPLLPVFYAILYPVLERLLHAKKREQAWPEIPSELYASWSPRRRRWSGKLGAITAGVAASLAAHTAMTAAAWAVTHRSAYPRLLEHVDWRLLSRWIEGEGARLSGRARLAFLGGDMLLASAVGGLVVGALSRKTPVLNGLLAGVIISMWMGANQFTEVYETLIEWSDRLGTTFTMAWKWYYGLCTALFLQAFCFAAASALGVYLRQRRWAWRSS